MPGIGETLTHKIGPLPVWVYAGLGVTGLAVVMARKKKKTATTADQAAQQAASSTGSNLGAVPISNLTTAASPMPFQTGDVFVTVPQSIQQSQTTNETEVNKISSPPPADHIDHPPPPHPPPPPRPQTYTVVRGDTLWGIAKKFYGNGAQWPMIFGANKGQIANPNLIFPGQVFVIPPK